MALNCTRSHNRRHITSKAHHKRNKRLAVKASQVHQFIHNKGRSRHISRVLHKRYKQIENQDVRQEHRNRPHTSDDTIDDKVTQWPITHHTADHLTQPAEARLNPLLRICTQSKGTPEHHKHYQQKERNTQIFMCYDTVNYRRVSVIILIARRVCLSQSALNKTIFLIGHGALHILSQSGLYSCNSSIALLRPLLIMLRLRQQLLHAAILLKHLNRPITWRETLGQLLGVPLHKTRKRAYLCFNG